jgi:Cu2+-containing amine oxidase
MDIRRARMEEIKHLVRRSDLFDRARTKRGYSERMKKCLPSYAIGTEKKREKTTRLILIVFFSNVSHRSKCANRMTSLL